MPVLRFGRTAMIVEGIVSKLVPYARITSTLPPLQFIKCSGSKSGISDLKKYLFLRAFPLRVPWRCFMAEVPSRRTSASLPTMGKGLFQSFAFLELHIESRLAFYNDATDLTTFEIRFTHVYLYTHTCAHLCSIYTSSSSDSHNFFSPSCIAQWFLMYAEFYICDI